MVENEEPHDLIMDRIVKEEFLKPWIEMAWHSGIWWYENEISKPKIFAFYAMILTYHMGQNSKQINITKCISKFLISGAKMLDKCVKSQK